MFSKPNNVLLRPIASPFVLENGGRIPELKIAIFRATCNYTVRSVGSRVAPSECVESKGGEDVERELLLALRNIGTLTWHYCSLFLLALSLCWTGPV